MPATNQSSAAPANGTVKVPVLDAEKANRTLRRGLVSLVILVVLAAGLILAIPGLHGVGQTLAHMQLGWIAAAVALEIFSCLGYVLAFLQVFETTPVRFGGRVALSELAFGTAVSLGGAGSVAVGAWLLIERGARPARVAERSAVLFLITSAVNVITMTIVGLALFVGILPGPRNPLLSVVPAAVGIAILAFFLALPRLSELAAAHQAPGRIQTLLTTTTESVRDTRDLLFKPDWRIVGAFAYLWCDIAVLAVCFAATGHSPPIAAIVLAYQIGYLSNVIPIPGGIGILDGSMVGMLVLYGVAATPAAAATIVYHAIALWIPAMWGTLAFLILRRTRHEPLTLRPTLAARRRLRADRRK
ncbi:MAG: lysylphosphatidylglycerol synthase transmembrane domain-containing protein [Solirubrobacteraceae bacterium]